MTHHLTIRMAWHDHKWDGTICRNPGANGYCTGSHSLLSDRLARDKRSELEQNKSSLPLDVLLPDYLPPCYWTSAAFANTQVAVVHDHPFQRFRDSKRLCEQLPAHSVFTWPFRLALTHSKAARKKQGQYFEDIDERVDRYLGRLEEGASLVFFYLNYDNPVSADEYKYAVVGFSLLTEHERSGEYSFTEKELDKIRTKDGMQNFPTRNWAIRISHDFATSGVRLPYHEYLEHIAEHPEDEEKLEEIRVLIEEPALRPGFKYVSEQLTHDQSLYLLYKLRRAFEAVERHGIVDPGEALKRVDRFIAALWKRRGLYPGLGPVVSQLARLSQGDTGFDTKGGDDLIAAIREHTPESVDLLDATFDLLASKSTPDHLTDHQKTLRQARRALRDYEHLVPVLRKLSLFSLTGRQVGRIIDPSADKLHAFGMKPVTPEQIAGNPYLLCELYVPATEDEEERQRDLDREQSTDAPIDYFTVDIGMFPDEDYLEPNEDLQDLGAASPERLRAFIIEALHAHQELGHCYMPIGHLLDRLSEHPLFHRERFVVGEPQLLAERARGHFEQRLHIEESNREVFFYLRETWSAERTVERVLDTLIKAPDHTPDLGWVDAFLDEQVKQLGTTPGFSESLFRSRAPSCNDSSSSKPSDTARPRPTQWIPPTDPLRLGVPP